MTTHTDRFPVLYDGGLTEQYGHNITLDGEDDFDLGTTRLFTVHLRIHGDVPDIADAARVILASGAECLTGDLLGGDSFAQWCEPFDDHAWYEDEGRALHVYFTAPSLPTARTAAAALARIADVHGCANSALTTAADWAIHDYGYDPVLEAA